MLCKLVFLIGLVFSLHAYDLELSGNHLDEPLMEKLVTLFHPDVLVETGTFRGDTAAIASKHFKDIYTVELAPKLFKKAQKRFRKTSNVHCLQGDSGAVFMKLLPQLKKRRVLFWLDAHFSGGSTAKGTSNTAVREELDAIAGARLCDCVILIDDIRGFHGKPEDVEWYGGYPSVPEVRETILSAYPNYEFYILGDIAIAFPKTDGLTVSPLVAACTASRLALASEEMLAASEETIGLLATTPEAAVLDQIHQTYVESATDAQTHHYLLWKGLLLSARGDHANAVNAFRRTIAAGYDKARVRKYLAEEMQLLEERD